MHDTMHGTMRAPCASSCAPGQLEANPERAFVQAPTLELTSTRADEREDERNDTLVLRVLTPAPAPDFLKAEWWIVQPRTLLEALLLLDNLFALCEDQLSLMLLRGLCAAQWIHNNQEHNQERRTRMRRIESATLVLASLLAWTCALAAFARACEELCVAVLVSSAVFLAVFALSRLSLHKDCCHKRLAARTGKGAGGWRLPVQHFLDCANFLVKSHCFAPAFAPARLDFIFVASFRVHVVLAVKVARAPGVSGLVDQRRQTGLEFEFELECCLRFAHLLHWLI